MSKLFDRRFLIVTGKGGVGRTSVTAALAYLAADRGLRVCAVSLAGERSLAQRLGVRASYEPVRVAPNLDTRCLTPTEAVSDFGRRKLGLPSIGRWFLESRLMSGFLDAVPGLSDVVQLGKIEDMLHHPQAGEPVYDLVILDGPATGHGLSLFSSARAMREATRFGPFADLASIIETFLADRKESAFVLTLLPDRLPAHEAVELAEALSTLLAPPAVAFVNQCTVEPPDAPWSAITQALAHDRTPEAQALSAQITRARERALTQADVVAQARTALAAHGTRAVYCLPQLDNPDVLGPLVSSLRSCLP